MSGGYEIVLWSILIVASVTDLLWGKIYNHLTLTSVVAGVTIRFFGDGLPSVYDSLLGIATAFILFFPLYYLKVLAAGDVKLLMAIGAWSHPALVLRIGLTAIVLGAIVGGYLLVRKNGGKAALTSMSKAINFKPEHESKMTRMPFGPAFLCSLLILKIAELKGWS